MKVNTARVSIGFRTGLLLTFVILIFSRCGTQPSQTTPTPGTFASVYSILQSHNCNECHRPAGAATTQQGVQLDFSTQALAFSTLTTRNVTSTSSTSCSAVRIVNTTTPANSYLLGVLFNSYYAANNFGGVSGCAPYNGHLQQFNISTSDQASLVQWVTEGAQNN